MLIQHDKISRPSSLGPTAFRNVEPQTRKRLDQLGRVRRFSAGQPIIRDLTQADFVGTVRSGVLRMQKSGADGRQHVVGLLVEGDMFGRVLDGSSEFSVEAATDVEICSIPRAEFKALLMHSPDLHRSTMMTMCDELDRARAWMIVLSHHKISDRLAGFLGLMRSRLASVDHLVVQRAEGVEVKIPISRTDLAHLLGTRPESICRAFHALEDDGEIVMLDPNRVLLRDLAAIAARAGEEVLESLPRPERLRGAA